MRGPCRIATRSVVFCRQRHWCTRLSLQNWSPSTQASPRLEWYFLRKAERDDLTWVAGDLVEAGPFVVVPFRLSDAGGAEWWQVAVYRIDNDHIAEIWLHEEAQPSRSPSASP